VSGKQLALKTEFENISSKKENGTVENASIMPFLFCVSCSNIVGADDIISASTREKWRRASGGSEEGRGEFVGEGFPLPF